MTQPRNSLFASAVLLVLAGVPLAAAAPKATDPLMYLPKDCIFVVSVRAADLLASDGWKELTKEIPDVNKGLDEMEGHLGLARANVSRIIFGVPDVDTKAKWDERPGPVILIPTAQAVNADGIKALQKQKRSKGAKLREFRAVKAGKYTLYEGPSLKFTFSSKEKPGEEHVYDGRGESFCIVADKLVIYGKARDLKAVLERDKMPELSKELQAALKEADMSKTIGFAAISKAAADPFGNMPPEMAKYYKSIKYAHGNCAVGKTIKASLTVVCKDDKSANEVRKILEAFIVMGKQQNLPKEIVAILDVVKLKDTGSKVMGELEVKRSDAVKAFKYLAVRQPPPPVEKPEVPQIKDKK